MSGTLRRISTGLGAWTAGAAASVAVSMLALTVIGGAGGDVQPPTPQPAMETGQVDATAGSASVPSTGGGTPQPTPAPAGAHPDGTAPSGPSAGPSASAGPQRQLSTLAGVVTARCTGQLAYLVSWSPAPGYRVDTVARGPASVAQVRFVSPSRWQAMAVRCVAGVPRLVEPDDDRRG